MKTVFSMNEEFRRKIRESLTTKLPQVITYRANGINYTFQQRPSGMRDPDIIAANITPEVLSDTNKRNIEWVEPEEASQTMHLNRPRPKKNKKRKTHV